MRIILLFHSFPSSHQSMAIPLRETNWLDQWSWQVATQSNRLRHDLYHHYRFVVQAVWMSIDSDRCKKEETLNHMITLAYKLC